MGDAAPPNIRELIERARERDERAFDQLFAAVRPDLERLDALHRTRAPDRSVADLLQDVSMRIWQSLDGFRGDRDPAIPDDELLTVFRAWAAQIARRTASNARRDGAARKRRPEGQTVLPLGASGATGDDERTEGRDPAASATTPSGAASRSERATRVRAALGRIEDEQARRIVALRFFEGAPLRTIAERLGISYDVARSRYESALRFLEGDLRDLE